MACIEPPLAFNYRLLPLLGRARLGVCFYFAPLLFDDVSQLAFHRLECVMDHFGQRFVRAVVFLLFVRDQLVPARNCHVNAHAELISFLMGMVRLFDRDVASVDVIAKFLKTAAYSRTRSSILSDFSRPRYVILTGSCIAIHKTLTPF